MPSAPPNSKLVSEMADAAPARSGGAALMTRSVVMAPIGRQPDAEDDHSDNSSHGDCAAAICVSSAKPTADSNRPAGDDRRRVEVA